MTMSDRNNHSVLSAPTNFIRQIIDKDIAANKNDGKVVTRFPPEPNGYLHIGHAKAIYLNFGVARDYGGRCRLRFDDTNPQKENNEYVESIKLDVGWLGFEGSEDLRFASDYFEQLYEFALGLIDKGKAYVCSLSPDEVRESRGTLAEPGRESPYRDRSVAENRELFVAMRNGEYADGEHVLRAKIDMAAANLNLRDPVIYRIRHASHYRTGDDWCIYPMYDYTQCLSDAIEGVTHSLCTLEFEDHRPLYDWVLDQAQTECHPQQIEFSRLNLTYTLMSKRILSRLVEEGHVDGWDDPRMPTLSGVRRRGYPAAALADLCARVGVTKKDNLVDLSVLENCVRENLDPIAPRVMAVLRPLRVVITTYPEDQIEQLTAVNHPNNPDLGTREVAFSRVIYIERDDFMEDPPKKFFRLAPGREVRLRYAYFIRCVEVVKDPHTGAIIELRCKHDPASRGGTSPDGRKVKGTLHWVAAAGALDAEVRLYDRLFPEPEPSPGESFADSLNSHSLEVLSACKLEASLSEASPTDRFQFERLGYFCLDERQSNSDHLVFNRTVSLRDSWAPAKELTSKK